MPILSQLYSLAGDFAGRPQIVETGQATDDNGAMNELARYETGRLEIVPLPRSAGLVAKSLDGQKLLTQTIETNMFGRFRNCLQLGKTQIAQLAPRQPVGPHSGRKIVTFQRVWVSLED